MSDDILNIRRKEYKHENYKYSFYPESVIRKFEFGRAKNVDTHNESTMTMYRFTVRFGQCSGCSK